MVFQWGNGRRLPGGTVYRWPVGLVHSMVPSGNFLRYRLGARDARQPPASPAKHEAAKRRCFDITWWDHMSRNKRS